MKGTWVGKELYLGALYVGEVINFRMKSPFAAEGRTWRTWCTDSAEGNSLGYYATEAEAKGALESWLVSALPNRGGGGND